jgi:RNA polymerase sigma-70 factor (ECF subfamily)
MTETAALNWGTPRTLAKRAARVDSSTPQDNLLERLRALDAEAFTALVADHQAVVLGLCQSLGLRGADVEQAAADVFANVFRALPNFDGRSKPGTWVYRIACRTILKAKARNRRHPQTSDLHDRIASRDSTPDRIVEEAELRERVWDAVASLPAREALAIEMYYRRGWPVQEIAVVLECPSGTVKTLLFRARERLKTIFAARGIRL